MRKFPLIWLAAAVCLSGCTALEGNYGQSPESFVSEGEDLCLPLALSVGTVKPQTKMTPAITQADATEASFRGIKEIYAIPFRAARPVNGSDERIGPNLLLPQQGIPSSFGDNAQDGAFEGLVRSNNSHLYKNVYMRRGTASMLVYGQAIDANVSVDPDSVAFKRRNGVLRAHNQYSADTPSAITFTLEPFITSANEASLQNTINGLLTYLNSIAGATVSLTGYARRVTTQTTWTYNWSVPTDYSNYADLKNAFDFFTANEVGFSAGSTGINQMLTTLYNRLYSMANSTTAGGSDYRLTYYGYNSNTAQYYYYVYQLATQIRTLINNSTYVTLSGSGANRILGIDWKIARSSLAIGLGPFLMNSAACIVNLFINQQLRKYGGDLAIGAYGIVSRISFLFLMIVMGFNQGMQPIAGYNYGARRYSRVRKVYLLTAGWATLVCFFGFILSEFLPKTAVSIFTNDPTLLELSAKGLQIMNIAFLLIGMQMVSTNFFQCLGMVGKSVFLSLSRQLLFLVPLVYILPLWLGVKGVWYSFPISDAVSFVVTGIMILNLMHKFSRLKDGDDPAILGSTIQ